MKKIINGKKYDTETAVCVAEKSWTDTSVNYSQYEFLFRKLNGEFFRFDDKRTTWGNIHNYKEIIPLTDQEAKRFCEENLSVDEYENLFGEVSE